MYYHYNLYSKNSWPTDQVNDFCNNNFLTVVNNQIKRESSVLST